MATPVPGRRARCLALLVPITVAIATTWPLAVQGGRLPLGGEPTPTVARFNLWTLRWTADRLPHALSGWWDAPIFSPHAGTFAWSEPQPLTGVAFALVRTLTGPERAYGLVLVTTLALNGIAGTALARRLGSAPAPAVLGGVLAQTIPFAFDQLGVLQLLALWPTLALLASIVAWAQEGRRRHAIAIGLSLAASALTCGYLFALTLLAVLPVALGAGLARARSDHVASARRWADLAWAVGLPLVLAGPVVVGQRRRLEGHRWLRSTIDAGSATASDWVGSGRAAPTLVLVALGLAGAWLGRRQPAARFVAAVGLLGAVASFGTNLAFGPVRPWAWLVDEVSAFAQLRSPYRSAFLAQLALAALGALALDALWRWRPTSKDATAWTGPAIAVVATALAVALAHPGPGAMAVAARTPGAWHDRLPELAAAEPATDPPAAVVFLPFAPSPATEDFAATTERMLQNLDTGVPMVNGYSGFFPSDHAALRAQLRGFPDRRSLVALGERGARWVVVDAATWDPFDERVAATLGISEEARDQDAVLLILPPPGSLQ